MPSARKNRLRFSQEQLQALFARATKPLTAQEQDKLSRYLVKRESLTEIRAHYPEATAQHIQYLIGKLPTVRRNRYNTARSPALNARRVEGVFKKWPDKYSAEEQAIIRAYLQKHKPTEAILRRYPHWSRHDLVKLVRRFRRNAGLDGQSKPPHDRPVFVRLNEAQFDWDMGFYGYPPHYAAAMKELIFGGKSIIANDDGIKTGKLNSLLDDYGQRLEKRRPLEYDTERPHYHAHEQAEWLSILNWLPITPAYRSIAWLAHTQHKSAKQLAKMHDCTPSHVYKVLETVETKIREAEMQPTHPADILPLSASPPDDLEPKLAELSAWLPPHFADIARDYYAGTALPLLSEKYHLTPERIRVILQDVQTLLGRQEKS